MSESRYNIVFHGELVGGADPAVVKQNLAKVFKMDLERVEKLFSGKAVVLKKDADKATAMKFRAVLKKAGAQCEMKALDAPAASAESTGDSAAAEPPKPRANFAARDPETRPLSEEAEAAEQRRRAEAAEAEAAAEDEDGPGGYPDVEEIEAAPPPEPSAPPAEQGNPAEQDKPAPADTGPPPDSELVGTIRMGGTSFSGEFDVAPTGSDMGDEKQPENVVNPDISHLSMAPPGADLEELPSGKKVEVPDISHLKVVMPEEAKEEKGDS